MFLPLSQVAAQGGTQKGVGHFFLFRSPFGNHFVTFFDVFGHFFAFPLLPPPFCGRVIVCAFFLAKIVDKNPPGISQRKSRDIPPKIGRREKTPHPQDTSQHLDLLRTPGRFTTRPLPVYFATKMSVVRPFSVLSEDEIGP